jgi:glucan phosphorylase
LPNPAERFKFAAQSWARIHSRVARLIADERQLRQFAAARITEQRDQLQARVNQLAEQLRAMESGSGLLDNVRQQFERVLSAGKEAAGRALAAVGAALPNLAGGLGAGIGLAVAAVAVVGLMMLRKS